MTHCYLLIAYGNQLCLGGKSKIVDSKVYRTREAAERAMSAFKDHVCNGMSTFAALDPNGLRIGVVEQEFVDE